jgi:hypothetical protein
MPRKYLVAVLGPGATWAAWFSENSAHQRTKRMNNRILIRIMVTGAMAAGVVCFSVFAAEIKPKRTATQGFMRQKLLWSQTALEGLALEKFDLVSKNAIRMRDMTHSNQWFTTKQPDYMRHTTNFQNSVEGLYKAAVDKNLDEATEAYRKVVRNCVDCHHLVRTEQRKNAGVPQARSSKPETASP